MCIAVRILVENIGSCSAPMECLPQQACGEFRQLHFNKHPDDTESEVWGQTLQFPGPQVHMGEEPAREVTLENAASCRKSIKYVRRRGSDF